MESNPWVWVIEFEKEQAMQTIIDLNCSRCDTMWVAGCTPFGFTTLVVHAADLYCPVCANNAQEVYTDLVQFIDDDGIVQSYLTEDN